MASGWCVYILWVHKTTLIVDIASWVTSSRRGLHCNAMERWIDTAPCGFETQECFSVKVLHCYKHRPLHSVLIGGGITFIQDIENNDDNYFLKDNTLLYSKSSVKANQGAVSKD